LLAAASGTARHQFLDVKGRGRVLTGCHVELERSSGGKERDNKRETARIEKLDGVWLSYSDLVILPHSQTALLLPS